MVLEIDKENRRLSLGHKQTEENPWDEFEKLFTVGSIHEGTVTSTGENKKPATVLLPYGVTAYTTPRHLTKENGQRLVEDEKAPFVILEFNKDNQRIFVSHARTWEEEKRSEQEKEEAKQATEKREISEKVASQKVEKATLGDLDALAELAESLDPTASEAQNTAKAESAE